MNQIGGLTLQAAQAQAQAQAQALINATQNQNGTAAVVNAAALHHLAQG